MVNGAARLPPLRVNVKVSELPSSAVTVADGVVSSGNRKATFGELAADAAAITPPEAEGLKLKDPASYRFIGKDREPAKAYGRLDSADKVNGKAQYALDYNPEGTLTALLARSPKFGGKVAGVDDAAAKAVPGVTDVAQIGNGVAVVATNFWAAKKGRDALKITWDNSKAETRSTDAILADYRKLMAKPGFEARKQGKGTAALKGAGEVITGRRGAATVTATGTGGASTRSAIGITSSS